MTNASQQRRHSIIYWICQILGWGLFAGGNALNLLLRDQLVPEVGVTLLVILFAGIVVTHIFRELVHRWRWQQLSLLALAPRILLASLSMSLIFTLIVGGVNDLMPNRRTEMLLPLSADFWVYVLNFTLLFLIWNVIYFAVHYFENQRRAEIRNLELRALNTEIELNNLRNQLRPHFMFNSLNSIRALIEENPTSAKDAVTTLSAILRNTLMIGKKDFVSLREELELVQKYLEMETIRFEERLKTNIHFPEAFQDVRVPPLMVQTLVENGIKHGIARLTEGGEISVQVENGGDDYVISVLNSGSLELPAIAEEESTGTGIANIRKRLQLLYGDKADFSIEEMKGSVVARLTIPKEVTYEGIGDR